MCVYFARGFKIASSERGTNAKYRVYTEYPPKNLNDTLAYSITHVFVQSYSRNFFGRKNSRCAGETYSYISLSRSVALARSRRTTYFIIRRDDLFAFAARNQRDELMQFRGTIEIYGRRATFSECV